MKHALVTGAAGSIGEALARALRDRNEKLSLSLADVSPRVDEVARELRAEPLRWDLARPEELEAEVAALVRARGPIDLLINNAGILEVRSFDRFPWATGERLLAIDLIAPLRLMSLVAPSMSERGEGAIVNVASMAGITPIRGMTYYGAAKAGLAMASEIARIELRPRGVRVVTVYPGPVRSDLERRGRAQLPETPASRWVPIGDPAVLAAKILRAIDEDQRRVVYPPLYDLASRFPTIAGRMTSLLSPAPRDA